MSPRRTKLLAAGALASLIACGCASSPKVARTTETPPSTKLAESAAADTMSKDQVASADIASTTKTVSYEAPGANVEEVAAPSANENEARATRPITLGAVLEVVDRDNPNVAIARERVFEAYAQWERAEILWLPSLRAGVNYNKHEGRIQDVLGSNVETSRGAFYSGLGANAVGAGSPAIPGLYANFHLTDAIFQPQIAGHVAQARQANARATSNDYLLQAAQAYLELLRATQDQAIADEVQEHAQKLTKLTKAYAESGEGLESDFDRARTELALRRNELLRTQEAVQVASGRLAQVLSLDPSILLEPLEPTVVPIELVTAEASIQSLVAQGLSSRPEVDESQALVCEAVRRLEREKYAPLVPSVLLGVSYGGFGAGRGSDIENFGDRFDGDAVAWWELRNLGHGEAAARRETGSRLQQARLRQVAVMDQVAREIVEAHAQVTLRRQQIETAKETVTIARRSFEKNLDRIENGQGLPLEAL